ncbi:MAG TPA: hypothetical protein VFA44_05110 [Gaiellaceae bacterium]|nr:hypothetical protein [Gaiellaceae bacterium]
MGFARSHRYLILGGASALAAAAASLALVLSFSGASTAAPSKAEYLARVAAICRVYGPLLDRVRPPDVAEPANVIAAIRIVLPLVKEQEREVRALTPPRELRAQLGRWFALQDARIAKLEEALRAADRLDLRTLSVAYVAFALAGSKVGRLGSRMGIPHPPC